MAICANLRMACSLLPAPRPASFAPVRDALQSMPATSSKTRNAWNHSSLTALITSEESTLCFQTASQKKKEKTQPPQNKRSKRPRGNAVSFLGKGEGL